MFSLIITAALADTTFDAEATSSVIEVPAAEFDPAAFRTDAAAFDVELARTLASDGWRQVAAGWVPVPVGADLSVLQGVLSVDPTFLTTSRTGHVAGDDGDSFVSNARIHRDEHGRVRAAAGGIRNESGECGGSWTSYTDWLVTYDADGEPQFVYTTTNQYGDALVRNTTTIGAVVYDGGSPVSLDVRSRERWLACDLCDNALLGSDSYADVRWTHSQFVYDATSEKGC